jgi:hypothetical protein
MRMPRSTSASTIPTLSTRSWSFGGTENRAISTMKTKRLSTLRLYSVSQPATNWPAYDGPNSTASRPPKPSATAT